MVVGRARPSASTSAMAIWTAAWSLEVMRRSIKKATIIRPLVLQDETSLGRTGCRTLAGDVEVHENALETQKISQKLHFLAEDT